MMYNFHRPVNNGPKRTMQTKIGSKYYIKHKTSDKEMAELQGHEVLQHLKYLKYASAYFFIVMVINLIVLIPVYVTGDPPSDQNIQPFDRLSIINIFGTPGKVWVSVASIFISSLGVFAIMYIFSKKTKDRLSSPLAANEENSLENHDIQQYAILVRGIPKVLEPRQASIELLRVLKQAYYDKIVSVQVAGETTQQQITAEKWKKAYEKLKDVQFANQNQVKREQVIVKDKAYAKILINKLCKCGSHKEDAEIYYKNKMKTYKQEVEKCTQIKLTNKGCAFVIFNDQDIVKDLINNPQKLTDVSKYEERDYQVYEISQWKVTKAAQQNDIQWRDLNETMAKSLVKKILLLYLLFLVCVVLLTPLTIVKFTKPFANQFDKTVDGVAPAAFYLSDYLTPLAMILINLVITPYFIRLVANKESHETYSSREVSLMWMFFGFLIINIFFIPLCGVLTIQQFLKYIFNNYENNDFLKNLGNNLGGVINFFLKYMMQISFVSNMISLLDIGHSAKIVVKRIRPDKKPQREQTTFADDIEFDLAKDQAQVSAIFMIGMVLSTIIPLNNIFSFVYFILKFFITKYNLIYVYNKEQHPVGTLKKGTMPITIFSIIIFQLLNYAFFYSNNTSQPYIEVGVALVIAQIVILYFSRKAYIKHEQKIIDDQVKQKSKGQLSSSAITQLEESYIEPWVTLKNEVAQYYQKRDGSSSSLSPFRDQGRAFDSTFEHIGSSGIGNSVFKQTKLSNHNEVGGDPDLKTQLIDKIDPRQEEDV